MWPEILSGHLKRSRSVVADLRVARTGKEILPTDCRRTNNDYFQPHARDLRKEGTSRMKPACMRKIYVRLDDAKSYPLSSRWKFAHATIIRQSLIFSTSQSHARIIDLVDVMINASMEIYVKPTSAPSRCFHQEMTILRGIMNAFNRDILSRQTHLYSFATPTQTSRPVRM